MWSANRRILSQEDLLCALRGLQKEKEEEPRREYVGPKPTNSLSCLAKCGIAIGVAAVIGCVMNIKKMFTKKKAHKEENKNTKRVTISERILNGTYYK